MPRAVSANLGDILSDLGDLMWSASVGRAGNLIGNRLANWNTILTSAILLLALTLNATTTLAIPAEPAVPSPLTGVPTAERGPSAPTSHLSPRLVQDSGTVCRIACLKVLDACVDGCSADDNDRCAFGCRTGGAACRRGC
jgi:hypothetical protein